MTAIISVSMFVLVLRQGGKIQRQRAHGDRPRSGGVTYATSRSLPSESFELNETNDGGMKMQTARILAALSGRASTEMLRQKEVLDRDETEMGFNVET